MPLNLRDQQQWRVDLLMAGRCAEIVDQYAFPFTLHLEDDTIIVRHPQEMIFLLETWRAAWKARGVTRLQVEVDAVSEVVRGRFRLWTTTREYGAAGWLLGQKSYIKHCRQTLRGIRTDAMEVIGHSPAQVWPLAEGRAANEPAG